MQKKCGPFSSKVPYHHTSVTLPYNAHTTGDTVGIGTRQPKKIGVRLLR